MQIQIFDIYENNTHFQKIDEDVKLSGVFW